MRLWISVFVALLLGPPIWAQDASDAVSPEAAGAGRIASSAAATAAQDAKAAGVPVEAASWMVSAANPLAVEALGMVLLCFAPVEQQQTR